MRLVDGFDDIEMEELISFQETIHVRDRLCRTILGSWVD